MFSSLKGAKEWASSLLEGSAPQSTNLDQFLEEVNNENTEHFVFQREVDKDFEEEECKPTYEQLSQSNINLEANRNIMVLRAFETILQER
jgi:hypothetical protein